MILSSNRYRLLKNFAYLPLFITISACGGGGGGGGSDGDASGQQPPANTAPLAVNDSVTTSNRMSEISIDVLANDSDSDGDTLSIVSVGISTEGVTPIIEGGFIRYSLPSDFQGSDEFTYTISDGEAEATATVTVSINSSLTVSGLIGETVSGPGTVSVKVGDEVYSATLDGSRFTAEIATTRQSDVVSVTAEFSQTNIGKPVALKSYAGFASQLGELAIDGAVSEAEAPSLYLSAANTSAAAAIERVAGNEPVSAETLIEASQSLPQNLILEGAVALKSVLAGDTSNEFIQPDTFSFLKSFPAAILYAEQLEENNPEKYEEYRSAIFENTSQALPLPTYDGTELLFIESSSFINRPPGFALQLTGASSGQGYLAESDFSKDLDNEITFTKSGLEILVNTEGLFASETFNDAREICAPDINGSYSATPTKRSLIKYLDTATFSAYRISDVYSCDATNATFSSDYRFAQVNTYTSGDLAEYTQGDFALSTYLFKDPSIFSGPNLWQAVVVSPNTSGSVAQRFDFASGYTDEGVMSFPGDGRMALNMNRGDYVEYIPTGKDGSAARVIAVLKRADGSLASMGGDLLVPISGTPILPTPAKLVYSDFDFTITDTSSSFYDLGFGFEFLADNTGHQLWRPDGAYESSALEFSWMQMNGFMELRYFYHRTEYPYRSSCPDGDSDCIEFRYRELEPIAEHNGDYFVRVYLEVDNSAVNGEEPGSDVWLSSYIDRFSVLP